MEDKAADDIVWLPTGRQFEAFEKAIVPFDEIGSRAELAPCKRERLRVGLDTDQAGFRAIHHQGLEKSAGSAANIDHPVAGDKVQLFDNPLSPEMFAGEQTDRPVVKGRQKALAKKRRKFAVIFRCGDICLLYTSPSPRDLSTSRMPSSA